MATTLLLSQTSGATGATAVQLTSTSIPCNSILVQANAANTTAVYIGDSTVNATNKVGIYIPAPAAGVPAAPILVAPSAAADDINLKDWYIASTTSGQAVTILFRVS